MVRGLFTLFVSATCLLAAPAPVPVVRPPRSDPPPQPSGNAPLPSADEFAELARTDPVAMIEAGLRRCRQELRGYRCVLQKQERVGGRLGPVEVIRLAVRDEPFAVLMKWEQGAGGATASLYVRGENGGKMKALSRLIGVTDADPVGILARGASRYSIRDSGLAAGMLRTYRVWKAARDAGRLRTEYHGTRPVPECGGRVCHVVKRFCDPPEVDHFSMDETGVRDPAKFPKEAIGEVTLYIDAETWVQIGSVILQPDGGLLGAYYFRDLQPNPSFPADQFKPAALRK